MKGIRSTRQAVLRVVGVVTLFAIGLGGRTLLIAQDLRNSARTIKTEKFPAGIRRSTETVKTNSCEVNCYKLFGIICLVARFNGRKIRSERRAPTRHLNTHIVRDEIIYDPLSFSMT